LRAKAFREEKTLSINGNRRKERWPDNGANQSMSQLLHNSKVPESQNLSGIWRGRRGGAKMA
jgi:hypothetical protein